MNKSKQVVTTSVMKSSQVKNTKSSVPTSWKERISSVEY